MKNIKKKRKRKLTRVEKEAKAKKKLEYETIFINGKQKRIKVRETVEGIDADEFIRRNADPVWVVENEMWELLEKWEY